MPESVRDRPTSCHEKIWLITKSKKYYYDADAIREPLASSSLTRLNQLTFGGLEVASSVLILKSMPPFFKLTYSCMDYNSLREAPSIFLRE